MCNLLKLKIVLIKRICILSCFAFKQNMRLWPKWTHFYVEKKIFIHILSHSWRVISHNTQNLTGNYSKFSCKLLTHRYNSFWDINGHIHLFLVTLQSFFQMKYSNLTLIIRVYVCRKMFMSIQILVKLNQKLYSFRINTHSFYKIVHEIIILSILTGIL